MIVTVKHGAGYTQMLLIIGAIILAPFITLFTLSLPLEPIHILWINLADSVFLTMPLLFEPKEKGLLNEPPRNPKAKIANGIFFTRVGLVAIQPMTFCFWYKHKQQHSLQYN